MKKLLTCAGLAAVGAASMHAQYLGDAQFTKPWMVSAKLRGFYDDNYATTQYPAKRGSYGFSVAPTAGYTYSSDLTSVTLQAGYEGRYFEDRTRGSMDHAFLADLKVAHTFSERYKMDLGDQFRLAQEPFLVEPGAVQASFIRTQGDNLRNTAMVSNSASLTEKLSAKFSFDHSFYDYEAKGSGSWSALLDRQTFTPALDLRWQFQPETTGILGYQFEATDFAGKYPLMPGAENLPAGNIRKTMTGDVRDSRSHFMTLGLDHSFNTALSFQVRGGAEYTQYPNAQQADEKWSPYADAKINYAYAEGSKITIGAKHTRYATDVALLQIVGGADAGTAYDKESTVAYAQINHKITARLMAIARASWQIDQLNSSAPDVDGRLDNYYSLGAELSFEINKFLFAEAGYSYDRLSSELDNLPNGQGVGRSFTRNIIYLGLRATY